VRHNSDDEYLEALWVLGEDDREHRSAETLKERMGGQFEADRLADLLARGMIVRDSNGRLSLGPAAVEYTRALIRSHRIAERLIHDVLGGEFEPGACEFEHVTNVGMVDAICTLLGHPRECPHGLPIPEGECCRQSLEVVRRSVFPLTELRAGQTARIAYVYSQNDSELHIVEGLQIRPGEDVKLHQKYPTYVLEIDGTNVALDPEVARNIQVWADTATAVPDVPRHDHRRRRRRGFLGSRERG
jgi:DtxR family Mn-dependent transcriptional regulator